MERFHKSLAKYYQKWYDDSIASIAYCKERGLNEAAEDYARSAENIKKIIDQNKEAIEFFSQGDNAGKKDEYLPAKFRGYE